MERTRRLLDADEDPVVVDEALAEDELLAPLVSATPGLRVPGHLDGHEVALQTVLGQQVSLASARTAAARLVAEHGDPLDLTGPHAVTHLFPSAGHGRRLDPTALRMPRSRGRALVGLAAALADGEVRLDRSSDRQEVRAGLLALPGIGPWTADYVAMRALGDPDVFLPTDIGVRNAATRLGIDDLADADGRLAAVALLRAAAALVGRARRDERPGAARPARARPRPTPERRQDGDIE